MDPTVYIIFIQTRSCGSPHVRNQNTYAVISSLAHIIQINMHSYIICTPSSTASVARSAFPTAASNNIRADGRQEAYPP